MAPFAAAECTGQQGPIMKGSVTVVAECTSWAGVAYSIVLGDFQPNVKFHYRVFVRYNGRLVYSGDTPSFYTSRNGSHFAFKSNQHGMSIDCGSGAYLVEAYAVSDDGKYLTGYDSDTATCG